MPLSESLIRFASNAELTTFMDRQEQGIERAKVAALFKDLASKIELRKPSKSGTPSPPLAGDAEREIMKQAYQLDLAPRTVLDAYCKNDEAIQTWLKRNYSVAIPVKS
jgi:hypothetical protein